MNIPTFRRVRGWLLPAAALVAAMAGPAHALPSYAQQTGLPCAQCHAIAFGPALTEYGRQFKLNGYALGEHKPSVPVALMAIGTYTQTGADLPDPPAEHTSTNDNFALNELTGFLATSLGKHAGAFVEVSYSGIERHTAWGAFDVRYARSFALGSHGVVAGVSLNNNPTVSDLWNSTPVWSFPYVGSELAPTPAAAPILFDGISETVLGPTFYAMLDDRLYVEAGAYRSLSDGLLRTVGLSADDNSHLRGVAPYWRAALQFHRDADYFSVGALGLYVRQEPDPATPGTNRYDDLGLDATWQRVSPDGTNWAANLSWVHEERRLAQAVAAGEAAYADGSLDSLHADVTWTWKQTWVVGAGVFRTTGSADALQYAPNPVDGSASGKPDSDGTMLQLEYVPFGKLRSPNRPWLNLRVGLQYTAYGKFNGAGSNYDGAGRSASDNDTLFGFVWVAL